MIDLFPTREIALQIGSFSVHWYGLMYFAAFIVAWYLLPRLQKYRDINLTSEEWSSILSWAVVGVIVGGRLGFVLFYGPSYYLAHPLEIFAVWKGGMASHGGFIGVTLAMMWALRKRKSDFWKIADIVVIPVAIGLAFGRMGNFINLELYGIPTTLPWGINIPGVAAPRHPTQIYAVIKDLFIAGMCYWNIRRSSSKPGETLALFLMLYGVLRFLVEFLREQNGVYYLGLSEGQWLTIPLFIIGAILWIRRSSSTK
jgi:phosphatidylglycerol:prolipoprotein diacylglycerol transferase